MGQKRGNKKTTQGAVRWGIAGSPAAGEDAGAQDGDGAETACSGARSRGAALSQLGRSQNIGGTAGGPYSQYSTGRCLRRCRRLHRASARHSLQTYYATTTRMKKMG